MLYNNATLVITLLRPNSNLKEIYPVDIHLLHVGSRPSFLLHMSGGFNFLTRCRLQMFLKQQDCVEYGNQTHEHQSGYQSICEIVTDMSRDHTVIVWCTVLILKHLHEL